MDAVAGRAIRGRGAFLLPAGTRDAALLVTLPPGAYTAHVAGVGVVEVYELP